MLTDVAGKTCDVDAVSFAVLVVVDMSVAYQLDRHKQSDYGV